MSDSPTDTADRLWIDRLPHRVVVPAMLALNAVLAVTSLLGDSITYDEPSKLTAGMSYLKTGDFRLEPDHPPVAKMWAALPLLWVENDWPAPGTRGWSSGNAWLVGRDWLFERNNGERLVVFSRCMIVLVLTALCACIYGVARSLFGRRAALVSLALAALSPTLLAHGRLVSNDVPLALFVLLTLWSAARLLQRITWTRLICVGAAAAGLSGIKFSWPLILPAIAAMSLVAILGTKPIELALFRFRNTPVRLIARSRRGAAVLAIVVFTGVFVWASLWTFYGWRYSPFRGADRETALMMATTDPGQPLPTTMSGAWETVLHDWDGKEARGVVPAFVRWARDHRLLPEACLYGLAYLSKTTARRFSYLNGKIALSGQQAYFPVAFAIKTPVATLLLLVAGVTAVALRRTSHGREMLLIVGLATYVIVYAYAAVSAAINIGHRHLVPIYPALLVFAGAAATWMRFRAGRWLVPIALAWLLVVNLWIHPHYLSFFNDLIGGPKNGHHYLADSNIDWGQDLKRLAKYARAHPDETIKLAYFGSAPPWKYGFECEMLPSQKPVRRYPAELTGGTYVISVTQLLGVYDPRATEAFWNEPRNSLIYARLHELAAAPPPADETEADRELRLRRLRQYETLRRRRLFRELREQKPDERIGYSLFVYRLKQAEIDEFLKP